LELKPHRHFESSSGPFLEASPIPEKNRVQPNY
jgi:hypothetical protein